MKIFHCAKKKKTQVVNKKDTTDSVDAIDEAFNFLNSTKLSKVNSTTITAVTATTTPAAAAGADVLEDRYGGFHKLRKQFWGGVAQKTAIFAYFYYYFCLLWGRVVKKGPKICLFS